ncbi:sulfite exporter TauE/SafE family protein [Endozoicomonas sp. Mp262]|uniref:sulfite exporter TauE/SafE family protein n=1 Tax=Endozoicomonas sp. Mp262 TaxID=2919499 RepID=UPI0021D967EA
MELSAVELLLAIAAVAAGSLVQGSIGFGLAVVAAPILYAINPVLIPGPIIVTALFIGSLTTHRYISALRIQDIRYAIVGRIPGSVLGGLLLSLVSARSMSLLLGGSVLIAVAASLTPFKFQANPRSLFTAGVLSGVMGTASSIGGPPMALVMQNEQGDRIRANLSAFFVVSCIISLVVLWAGGMFGIQHLLYGLSMVPGVFIGNWLAGMVAPRVNRTVMKRALLFLCSFSGVSAIWAALH